MITNRQRFYLAVFLLTITSLLITAFPHRHSFGVLLVKQLRIPRAFAGGFDTVGIVTLVLLIVGIYLLGTALEKYRFRIGILAIILVFFLPSFVISSYQKTFAKGIYAIDYDKNDSHCQFEMNSSTVLYGECFLPFTNYQNEELTFSLRFSEELPFEDDIPVVTSMNENGPFQITLRPKESRLVRIEANIDVSKMERYIEGGSAHYIDIIISAKGKTREL